MGKAQAVQLPFPVVVTGDRVVQTGTLMLAVSMARPVVAAVMAAAAVAKKDLAEVPAAVETAP